MAALAGDSNRSDEKFSESRATLPLDFHNSQGIARIHCNSVRDREFSRIPIFISRPKRVAVIARRS